jgi:hypothetical protein
VALFKGIVNEIVIVAIVELILILILVLKNPFFSPNNSAKQSQNKKGDTKKDGKAST